MEPVECRRTEEFGYTDGGAVTGEFSTTVPFQITVDLGALLLY
jgi:hypothetical protein